jgi:hypothetical protein
MNPDRDIILTRYLYIQDEVKKALLVSILNKSDDSIFWAYELFYSGISKKDFFNLIWNIYYDFFAILNPSFESYLIKKQKETIKNNKKLISAIIQNFLIRPFNIDVFMNYNIYIHLNETHTKSLTIENCENSILNKDYKSISKYLLNINIQEHLNIFKSIIDIFIKLNYKLNKNRIILNYCKIITKSNSCVSIKKILLSKVLSLFTNIKKGKNFYVVVDPEEVVQYETIKVSDNIRNYNILKYSTICGINDSGMLNLFNNKRGNITFEELNILFNRDWLYYASFSPFWNRKINKYYGIINHETKSVSFKDDDYEELFRSKYDYEPDEQSLLIKTKIIPRFNKSKWNEFYTKYRTNNLIQIDTNILNKLDDKDIKF